MPFKFCPVCAGNLKEITQGHQKRLQCVNCGFIFYQNSKPCVTAVIFDKGEILLGSRAHEPAKGAWDLLGGFLEAGEHPEDGLRRELKEETGLDLVKATFLGMFMDKYPGYNFDTLNIAYLCEVTGEAKANDDVAELRWFALDVLPDDLAFQNTKDTIRALENYLENNR